MTAERENGGTGAAIAAIVVPCSARKAIAPHPRLHVRQLPHARQDTVARAWLEALESAAPGLPAAQMYQGSGFRRGQAAAEAGHAPLFVVSAGLGLVAGATPVPAYELTLSPSAAAPLPERVRGAFSADAWWQAMQTGPFAAADLAPWAREGRVLVALTRPYATLLSAYFTRLTKDQVTRMRLFGPGLRKHLPAVVQDQVIAFRPELDALMPGLRLDAGVRSLAHFAQLPGLTPKASVREDQEVFDASLRGYAPPASPRRDRLSDQALRRHASKLAGEGLSATAALAHLRTTLGVACEAGRFRRVFAEVCA